MEKCGCVGLRVNNDSVMASTGHSVKYCPVHEAAPLMLAALEMVEAASTIYDSDELTPAQLEIQQAAKAAGVTPVEYVMSAVHAAIAAARRARGSSDDRR